MIKIISILLSATFSLMASMLISAGGYDVTEDKGEFSFKNKNFSGENVNITKVLHQESHNTNAITIWITKDWKEEWYDVETTQNEIIDKGYTPVFIFYWFADAINVEYVKQNEKAYFKTLKKFTRYLKKLHGQKIVVLNPEYNMFGVEEWEGMNEIFLKSYEILREDSQLITGPCVGDFGDYTQMNEKKEWQLFDASLHRAVKEADFIAFQEMRALTRNSKEDILRTPIRAYYFSKYLYKKYKKPTFLAYTAISSYGEDGEVIQAEVYKEFIKYLPMMRQEAKLMHFGTFHYFDYPGHVGYFNEAEEFFGILRSDGSKKPSFKYYKLLE